MNIADLWLSIFLDISYEVIILLFLIFYIPYSYSYLVSTTRYYISARREKATSHTQILKVKKVPKVTFIIPAYNEEVFIITAVKTILDLSYSNFDVVISDNGSTDQTLPLLKKHFNLFPLPAVIPQKIPVKGIKRYYKSRKHSNLTVIEKSSTEKSSGQNAALNISDAPYFITVDADTLVEDKDFMETMTYLLTRCDTEALGSLVGVANECKVENEHFVATKQPQLPILRLQRLDYNMTVITSRFGGIYTGTNLVVPGAFGIFNRERVMQLGGFSEDTLLNDADMTLALHKQSIEKRGESLVRTVPFMPSYTLAPATIKEFVQQRERWERGTVEVFKKYKEMLFWSRYANIGNFGLIYHAIQTIVVPLLQLYVILIFPIGLYIHYYNIEKIILILITLILIKAFEAFHVMFVKDIALRTKINLREFLYDLFYCGMYYTLLFPVLHYSTILGMWRFLKGNVSWRKIKRVPPKETA